MNTKHADIIQSLLSVTREAGFVTLRYFRTATAVNDKRDGSPVTLADQESEALITQALQHIAPDIPIIGEEAVAAGSIPDISSGRFFCVDPLDGTREFIEGGAEYSINIALLENFRPVAGIIYAPVTQSLYYAYDQQAFVQEQGGISIPLRVRSVPSEGMTVVTSKRHGKNEKMDEFLQGMHVQRVIKSSSAMKFCDVAAGRADLYPRLGPTSEWDTAAGEAILHAAGGRVTQLDATPMQYGRAERKFANPSFVARGA